MANEPQTPKVLLYSYNKAWNVEKKIYSIMNMILPAPLNPYLALAIMGLLCVVLVLERIAPVLTDIPTILRYLAFPFIGAQYLMKKKLDGKNPLKYLFGIVIHVLAERGSYIERFTSNRDTGTTMMLNWYCLRGKDLPVKAKRIKKPLRYRNSRRKR